ncbi:MAG: ATP-dependent Clp protease ATP-binding subunit [Epulopiscium sp.]|nr:ATP-dependent Clp protease ATP-binding subunit [Candidatus Epulonipiscium sp.]
MMMCSICKKNVAIIFTSKISDGKTEMVGLCMPCAKKQGIAPINQMLQQSGMTEEELNNLNEQMMDMLQDVDINDMIENFDETEDPQSSILQFVTNTFSKLNPKDKENAGKQQQEKSSQTTTSPSPSKIKKKRKYLDSFGINLTNEAKQNKVDRIIGRHREIDRIIQILNRRTKNNPILIGEPGVGKTAIAEGLAVRIVEKQVPVKLYNAEVYLLDLTAVVAGTQFRGQFESRMKSIIKEAEDAGNIILVIDEVHNIIGAGVAESGAMNAANILKPALARGEIQIIGATTLDEYRKYIEKDAALERRFQPVLVEQPSIEESIEILEGIKDYYEEYHKIKIPHEVIEKAVVLSDRYITDRFLPDKAIDVIDEAGSRANLKNQGLVELQALKSELEKLQEEKEQFAQKSDFEKVAQCKMKEIKLIEKIKAFEQEKAIVEITVDDVAYVIEAWTKIPVQKITELEAEKLLNLEERLHQRVVGQTKGVSALARAIRRTRSGFRKINKPSSFIFVGPTGVGKTELAKALAHELFGSEDALVRLDMSEYMEKHTVSKLIGAPPGYIGYDQGGQLTEQIRRKPYSVILLDEIEKAHPDVFNMLLQILEDGRLTDNQGKTVHFENTMLIMTSNAGTSLKAASMGFVQDEYKAREYQAQDALKEIFRPEFLNRIDEIVVFTELSTEELRKIVDLMLKEVKAVAKDKNMTLSISDEAKEFLVQKGYDSKYGARPLRRVIQKYIEDEIAEGFLRQEYYEGCKIHVTYEQGTLHFHKAIH